MIFSRMKRALKWNKKHFSLFHKCSLLDLKNKLAKMWQTKPLSKQQTLEVYLKANQQINFSRNVDQAGNTMFFIIEEAKETILNFSEGSVKVLGIYFLLM